MGQLREGVGSFELSRLIIRHLSAATKIRHPFAAVAEGCLKVRTFNVKYSPKWS